VGGHVANVSTALEQLIVPSATLDRFLAGWTSVANRDDLLPVKLNSRHGDRSRHSRRRRVHVEMLLPNASASLHGLELPPMLSYAPDILERLWMLHSCGQLVGAQERADGLEYDAVIYARPDRMRFHSGITTRIHWALRRIFNRSHASFSLLHIDSNPNMVIDPDIHVGDAYVVGTGAAMRHLLGSCWRYARERWAAGQLYNASRARVAWVQNRPASRSPVGQFPLQRLLHETMTRSTGLAFTSEERARQAEQGGTLWHGKDREVFWRPTQVSAVLGSNITLLHVPKCAGTTFQAIVYRAGCGAEVLERNLSDGTERPGLTWPGQVLSLTRWRCPHAFRHFAAWHAPLAPAADCAGSGRCVTVLRRPAERVASGFWHNLHDCAWLRHAVGKFGEGNDLAFHAYWKANATLAHVRLYAACVGSCASRMLAGRACGRCTEPDVGLWQRLAGGGGAVADLRSAARACLRSVWRRAFGSWEAPAGMAPAAREQFAAAIDHRCFRPGLAALKRRRGGASEDGKRTAEEEAAMEEDDEHGGASATKLSPLLERASAALRAFAFVGIQEELDFSMRQFARRFGIAPLPSDGTSDSRRQDGWRPEAECANLSGAVSKSEQGHRGPPLTTDDVLRVTKSFAFTSDEHIYREGIRHLHGTKY